MLMAKVKDPKYPILDRRMARAESVNWVKPKEKIFVRALEKSHIENEKSLSLHLLVSMH